MALRARPQPAVEADFTEHEVFDFTAGGRGSPEAASRVQGVPADDFTAQRFHCARRVPCRAPRAPRRHRAIPQNNKNFFQKIEKNS
ncbi:MAG: hypothetical protein IJU52_09960 [Clostridia bacterium]|nr:hypothetical protein [Clostridia bacterium]